MTHRPNPRQPGPPPVPQNPSSSPVFTTPESTTATAPNPEHHHRKTRRFRRSEPVFTPQNQRSSDGKTAGQAGFPHAHTTRPTRDTPASCAHARQKPPMTSNFPGSCSPHHATHARAQTRAATRRILPGQPRSTPGPGTPARYTARVHPAATPLPGYPHCYPSISTATGLHTSSPLAPALPA